MATEDLADEIRQLMLKNNLIAADLLESRNKVFSVKFVITLIGIFLSSLIPIFVVGGYSSSILTELHRNSKDIEDYEKKSDTRFSLMQTDIGALKLRVEIMQAQIEDLKNK